GPIRCTEEIAVRLHQASGIDPADSVKRFPKERGIPLYEPHRKSLLQAQSLPAQTRRTDRRGSAARPRNLRRNLQTLGMYKFLQIVWLSGRYRMIGFRSKSPRSNT